MENKNYVFKINWKSHRVGTLAWIDKNFYLIQRDKEQIKGAYNDGFKGIHGFDPDIVYGSDELFDFFLRRTLKKEPNEQCEDLASSRGFSTVDSFTLEEVHLSEKAMELFKNKIFEKYNESEKRKIQLQNEKKQEEIKDSEKKEDSDEFPDIK